MQGKTDRCRLVYKLTVVGLSTTNCCRLVYTLIAVGRVSADPMRKLDCLPKFGSAKNSKSKAKVRCWQSNPMSKVNESKIGYTVKLQYESCRKRCRRRNPRRKLDCLPKFGSTNISKSQVETCVFCKVYSLELSTVSNLAAPKGSNWRQ